MNEVAERKTSRGKCELAFVERGRWEGCGRFRNKKKKATWKGVWISEKQVAGNGTAASEKSDRGEEDFGGLENRPWEGCGGFLGNQPLGSVWWVAEYQTVERVWWREGKQAVGKRGVGSEETKL